MPDHERIMDGTLRRTLALASYHGAAFAGAAAAMLICGGRTQSRTFFVPLAAISTPKKESRKGNYR
jgi:hypothetical protein